MIALAAPSRDTFVEDALAWAREHGFDGDKLPKGQRKSVTSCPLAEATGLFVGAVQAWSTDQRDVFDLPGGVRLFSLFFDRGMYPEFDVEAGDA